MSRDVAQRLRRLFVHRAVRREASRGRHRRGAREADRCGSRRAAGRSRAALAGRSARRRSRRVLAGLRRGRSRVRRSRAPPDPTAAAHRGRRCGAAARNSRAAREWCCAVRCGDAIRREEAADRARSRCRRGRIARHHHRRRRARRGGGHAPAHARHRGAEARAARDRLRLGVARAVRAPPGRSRTASSITQASGTSSATVTSAAMSARSASIGSRSYATSASASIVPPISISRRTGASGCTCRAPMQSRCGSSSTRSLSPGWARTGRSGEVTMRDDGSAELLVDCEGFEWVSGWVLQLGRHAWIEGTVRGAPGDARARRPIARRAVHHLELTGIRPA